MRSLGNVSGRRVLDLGCGDGTLANLIARRGASVVGADISHELVSHARRSSRRNPRFFVEDATRFHASRRFHVVTAAFLLNELAPPAFAAVLTNAGRNLLVGGRLIVLLPHPAFADAEQTSLVTRRGLTREQYLKDGRRYEVGFNVGRRRSVTMTERHYSLGFIVSAMNDAGFLVASLNELSYPRRGASPLPFYLLIHCTKAGS